MNKIKLKKKGSYFLAVRTGSSSLFSSSFYIYILINFAIHYDGLKKCNLGIEKKKRGKKQRTKQNKKREKFYFIFLKTVYFNLQTQRRYIK